MQNVRGRSLKILARTTRNIVYINCNREDGVWSKICCNDQEFNFETIKPKMSIKYPSGDAE